MNPRSLISSVVIATAFFFVSSAVAEVRYASKTPTFYVGQTVNYVPQITVTDGTATNCQGHSLPPGLQLDPKNCAITGTVMFIDSPGWGFQTAIMRSPTDVTFLQIRIIAPTVKYPTDAPSIYSGQMVTIRPKLTGFTGRSPQCRADQLPSGLRIDPDTCAITGMSNWGTENQSFLTNIFVERQTPQQLFFRVLEPSVKYSITTPQFRAGQVVNFIPKVAGYTTSHPGCTASGLPNGLQINPQTCAITGTLPEIVPEFNIHHRVEVRTERGSIRLLISILPAT